ncbi:N-6 DNA methylase [Streptomyces sp. Li-HN-5-11]|uniref:N-6 DNA methylase n=1 Tax=Streptomyces sp. Li-HN-5-11 TaxID=3075432 RepID=UPI0028AE45E2|nr:N-6 DNA methylase [Streptomyces sp. Li-HN-5-11]WNM36732.1 N-6 DNA methylase [Streptomyces sp. Li-HN-5-11]
MVQFDLFGEVEQKLEERAQRQAVEAAKPKAVPHITSRRKHRVFPSDPHRHAGDIADSVIAAWFSHYGGSRMDVPLGTIAALCFFREPRIDDWLLTLQPAQLSQLLREIWGFQWMTRPDLIEVARPLHDWLEEDPDEHQLKAVQAVVHAAVHKGLLDLTARDDPSERSEADVLSPLLTGLRYKSDKKWRGEYHTPPCVTDLMAEILVHDDHGPTIREPALGSGGMFRSVAQTLRSRDLNPHDYTWFGNDIDPLATACAAVNAIVWDLGPRTVIWCADSLATEDAGLSKALTEREAVINHRNAVVEQARFERRARQMLHAFNQLLDGAAE